MSEHRRGDSNMEVDGALADGLYPAVAGGSSSGGGAAEGITGNMTGNTTRNTTGAPGLNFPGGSTNAVGNTNSTHYPRSSGGSASSNSNHGCYMLTTPALSTGHGAVSHAPLPSGGGFTGNVVRHGGYNDGAQRSSSPSDIHYNSNLSNMSSERREIPSLATNANSNIAVNAHSNSATTNAESRAANGNGTRVGATQGGLGANATAIRCYGGPAEAGVEDSPAELSADSDSPINRYNPDRIADRNVKNQFTSDPDPKNQFRSDYDVNHSRVNQNNFEHTNFGPHRHGNSRGTVNHNVSGNGNASAYNPAAYDRFNNSSNFLYGKSGIGSSGSSPGSSSGSSSHQNWDPSIAGEGALTEGWHGALGKGGSGGSNAASASGGNSTNTATNTGGRPNARPNSPRGSGSIPRSRNSSPRNSRTPGQAEVKEVNRKAKKEKKSNKEDKEEEGTGGKDGTDGRDHGKDKKKKDKKEKKEKKERKHKVSLPEGWAICNDGTSDVLDPHGVRLGTIPPSTWKMQKGESGERVYVDDEGNTYSNLATLLYAIKRFADAEAERAASGASSSSAAAASSSSSSSAQKPRTPRSRAGSSVSQKAGEAREKRRSRSPARPRPRSKSVLAASSDSEASNGRSTDSSHSSSQSSTPSRPRVNSSNSSGKPIAAAKRAGASAKKAAAKPASPAMKAAKPASPQKRATAHDGRDVLESNDSNLLSKTSARTKPPSPKRASTAQQDVLVQGSSASRSSKGGGKGAGVPQTPVSPGRRSSGGKGAGKGVPASQSAPPGSPGRRSPSQKRGSVARDRFSVTPGSAGSAGSAGSIGSAGSGRGGSPRSAPKAKGTPKAAAKRKPKKKVKRNISNFFDETTGEALPPPKYGDTTERIWDQLDADYPVPERNIKFKRGMEALNKFKDTSAILKRDSKNIKDYSNVRPGDKTPKKLSADKLRGIGLSQHAAKLEKRAPDGVLSSSDSERSSRGTSEGVGGSGSSGGRRASAQSSGSTGGRRGSSGKEEFRGPSEKRRHLLQRRREERELMRKKAEQGATVLETLFGGSPGSLNGNGSDVTGHLDGDSMMPIAGIFGKSSPLTTGPLARFVDTSGATSPDRGMKKAKRKRSMSDTSSRNSPHEVSPGDAVVKRLSETDAGTVKRRKRSSTNDNMGNDNMGNDNMIVDQNMVDVSGSGDVSGGANGSGAGGTQKRANIPKSEKKLLERDRISLGGNLWRVEADLRAGLKGVLTPFAKFVLLPTETVYGKTYTTQKKLNEDYGAITGDLVIIYEHLKAQLVTKYAKDIQLSKKAGKGADAGAASKEASKDATTKDGSLRVKKTRRIQVGSRFAALLGAQDPPSLESFAADTSTQDWDEYREEQLLPAVFHEKNSEIAAADARRSRRSRVTVGNDLNGFQNADPSDEVLRRRKALEKQWRRRAEKRKADDDQDPYEKFYFCPTTDNCDLVREYTSAQAERLLGKNGGLVVGVTGQTSGQNLQKQSASSPGGKKVVARVVTERPSGSNRGPSSGKGRGLVPAEDEVRSLDAWLPAQSAGACEPSPPKQRMPEQSGFGGASSSGFGAAGSTETSAGESSKSTDPWEKSELWNAGGYVSCVATSEAMIIRDSVFKSITLGEETIDYGAATTANVKSSNKRCTPTGSRKSGSSSTSSSLGNTGDAGGLLNLEESVMAEFNEKYSVLVALAIERDDAHCRRVLDTEGHFARPVMIPNDPTGNSSSTSGPSSLSAAFAIQFWEMREAVPSAVRFTLVFSEGWFARDMKFIRSRKDTWAIGGRADVSEESGGFCTPRKECAQNFLACLALLRGDGKLQLYSIADTISGHTEMPPVWEAKVDKPFFQPYCLGSGVPHQNLAEKDSVISPKKKVSVWKSRRSRIGSAMAAAHRSNIARAMTGGNLNSNATSGSQVTASTTQPARNQPARLLSFSAYCRPHNGSDDTFYLMGGDSRGVTHIWRPGILNTELCQDQNFCEAYVRNVFGEQVSSTVSQNVLLRRSSSSTDSLLHRSVTEATQGRRRSSSGDKRADKRAASGKLATAASYGSQNSDSIQSGVSGSSAGGGDAGAHSRNIAELQRNVLNSALTVSPSLEQRHLQENILQLLSEEIGREQRDGAAEDSTSMDGSNVGRNVGRNASVEAINKPSFSSVLAKESGTGAAYYGCYQSPQRRCPILACDFCPHYTATTGPQFFVTGDNRGNVSVWSFSSATSPVNVFQTVLQPVYKLIWCKNNLSDIIVKQRSHSSVLNLCSSEFKAVLPSTERLWATGIPGVECADLCETTLGVVSGWSFGQVLCGLYNRKGVKQSVMQQWFASDEGHGTSRGMPTRRKSLNDDNMNKTTDNTNANNPAPLTGEDLLGGRRGGRSGKASPLKINDKLKMEWNPNNFPGNLPNNDFDFPNNNFDLSAQPLVVRNFFRTLGLNERLVVDLNRTLGRFFREEWEINCVYTNSVMDRATGEPLTRVETVSQEVIEDVIDDSKETQRLEKELQENHLAKRKKPSPRKNSKQSQTESASPKLEQSNPELDQLWSRLDAQARGIPITAVAAVTMQTHAKTLVISATASGVVKISTARMVEEE